MLERNPRPLTSPFPLALLLFPLLESSLSLFQSVFLGLSLSNSFHSSSGSPSYPSRLSFVSIVAPLFIYRVSFRLNSLFRRPVLVHPRALSPPYHSIPAVLCLLCFLRFSFGPPHPLVPSVRLPPLVSIPSRCPLEEGSEGISFSADKSLASLPNIDSRSNLRRDPSPYPRWLPLSLLYSLFPSFLLPDPSRRRLLRRRQNKPPIPSWYK